jgi:AraC-like DNA-binding protein
MYEIMHIKNMVCNRCIATVLKEFNVLEFNVKSIQLGLVQFETVKDSKKQNKLEIALNSHGFEIIREESKTLIEAIKIELIKKIENQDNANLSSLLVKTFNKSYSALSKLFSRTEGMTIEKYEINLKIEKVKELIQLRQLNFSEIAYSLDYNNSGHLARQFKNITGMSMTEFKNLQKWDRKSIDKIV